MSIWSKEYSASKFVSGFEDFLTLSWVFKMSSEFTAMCDELAWRGNVDEAGALWFPCNLTISKLSDTVPEIVIRKQQHCQPKDKDKHADM